MKRLWCSLMVFAGLPFLLGPACASVEPADLAAEQVSSGLPSTSGAATAATATTDSPTTISPPATTPAKPSELDRVKTHLFSEPDSFTTLYDSEMDEDGNLIEPRDRSPRHRLLAGFYRGYWCQGFIRFDLAGLPAVANRVEIKLLCSEAENPSELYVEKIGGNWNLDSTQPVADENAFRRLISPPAVGLWSVIDITDWFNDWQAHSGLNNYGLRLRAVSMTEPTRDSYCYFYDNKDDSDLVYKQPRLVITTGAVPSKFVFPLTGNYHPTRITGYRFGDDWENETCLSDYHYALKHTGNDLEASMGEEVRAVKPGVVVCAIADNTWGGYVVVEHEAAFTTSYLHVWPAVNVGDNVTAGQKLAIVAPATNYSPHLHFQVRRAQFENPWSLRGRLPEINCLVLENGPIEPAWPERFLDPEFLDWE